jgi:hypothetical protein
MTRIRLAATLAALALAAGRLPAADPTPDLALVPADAVGFAHVRLAEAWQHDTMSGLRGIVAAAGPKAMTAFEKQVYPDPSTLDRATVIVMPPADGKREPGVVGVIGFTEKFDRAKLQKLYLPAAAERTTAGQTYYADANEGVAIAFPDDRHLLAGPVEAVAAFLARRPVPEGPLAPAIRAAAGKAVVAAVNVKALPVPPQAFEQVPEPFRPLLKAERATLVIDLAAADPVVSLRAGFPGADAAADAEKAVRDAAKMAKGQLAGPRREVEGKLYEKADAGPRPLKEVPDLVGALVAIGGMNELEKLLDNPPLTRDGAELSATVTVPKALTAGGGTAYTAVAVGLLLPAVQKVREAAGRAKGQNNLKQIGLAIHNYHDANGLMPDNIYSKDGKPLLSWRVHLLPYVEQAALYNQFRLNEPWDSEHNRKLLDKMPPVYVVPNTAPGEPGKTFYQAFIGKKGPNRPFLVEGGSKTRMAEFTDGLSNTLLVAEAARAVEWTKPEDLPFDPSKPLPKLGGHSPGGFSVLMGDGSVRFIRSTIDPTTLKALITINGGEVFNLD